MNEFLDALRESTDFEAGARALLLHTQAQIVRSLHAAGWTGARVLRSQLHLRPDEAYAGIWVLEVGTDGLSAPGADANLITSASAWRHVSTQRRLVEIDVNLRRVRCGDAVIAADEQSRG